MRSNRERNLAAAVAVALMIGNTAWAWSPGESIRLDLDIVPAKVIGADLNGGIGLVAVNAEGTWILHPRTGKTLASLPIGGTDVIVRDIDGNDWQDLLICSASGVTQIPLSSTGFGEPVNLISEPCRAIASIALPDQELGLVTAASEVQIWTVGLGGRVTGPETLQITITGPPMLAATEDRFAASGAGDRFVIERSQWGASSIAAGGPVGGIAMGPQSWIWSLTNQAELADLARQRVEVAPGPGKLASADLDGDGQRDVLVSHPELRLVGFVLSSRRGEQVIPVKDVPSDVFPFDLNRDGCTDLALTLDNTAAARVVWGKCTADDVEPHTAVLDPAATPDSNGISSAISGIRDSGTDTLPSGEDPKVPPVSPSDLVIDTAPTPPPPGLLPLQEVYIRDEPEEVRIQIGQTLQLQLRDPDRANPTFAARGGPKGFVVLPSGEVTYQPKLEHVGSWKVGIRVWGGSRLMRRGSFTLIVDPPDDLVEMNEANAEEARRMTDEEVKDLNLAAGEFTPSALSVRGCAVGVGISFGGTDTTESWTYIGQPFRTSGSPAASLSCEGGRERSIWWFAGVDTAPVFSYILSDIMMRHGVAATIGAGWSFDDLRVGGYGTAGLVMLGLGARATWMPFRTRTGTPHGFDVRATWLPNDSWAFEATVLYSWKLGPLR